MENILRIIKEDKLLKAGEVVGVAVSGGSDSMSLLHYLNAVSRELDIEVVAIHIDHCIRENSSEDAMFVQRYCKENGIRVYKFKVDVPKLVEQRKESVEKVARDVRYGVFDSLIKKDAVDKIAIAHNQRDQAETILLNLFRGAGLEGASGMNSVRNNVYIRPMLSTTKKAILDYNFLNDVPYVEDETNKDNTYSRNYLRNLILPLIEERWPGATQKIVNFGNDCADDNNYINDHIVDDAIWYEEKSAKIPNSYFVYANSIVSRIIFKTLKHISAQTDIERIHIKMIKDLALYGENGKKIKLPNNLTVFKEYDHITIINKKKEKAELKQEFCSGKFTVENFGTITVKRTKNRDLAEGELMLDAKKLPEDAEWRFRQRGDVFEKFGGGTKKLKDYLIDKKIPARIRENIPVLASGKTIYAIAGVEISESVRVDETTAMVTKITVTKE